MDETNLTPRQRKILDILGSQTLTREAISARLEDIYPVSKATLHRELLILQGKNLVSVSGRGRQTVYGSLENPLLRYYDLHDYFREDSGQRLTAKDAFDFAVFRNLPDFFSDRERSGLIGDLKSREKTMDPTLFRREIERFTVEFSWKSSRIEGNTYTLLETELLIKKSREAAGHPKHEATMILNHKNAIDYILSNREEYITLSEASLIKIHHLITKDLDISAGLRKNEAAITGTNYLPLATLPEIRKAIVMAVKTVNETGDPLAKALLAHALVAYIQPFADGNKRTARTVANAVLIAHGLYPLSYRNLDELEYIQSLILFYEQNTLYHLKRIFVSQLRFALENYFRS